MKHSGKALFGVAVTLFLLWWVLADVPFGEVLANIRQGNFLLLLASVSVATFGFFIRALRWKILLTPVRENTALRSRFAAVSIGFMANNILPARMGEFARAYAFSRLEPVTASAAFGTLVVAPSSRTYVAPDGLWLKSVRKRVSPKSPPAFRAQLKLRVISEVFWLLGLKGAKSAVRSPWETLPSLPVGAAGERTGRTPTKFCSSANNTVDL